MVWRSSVKNMTIKKERRKERDLSLQFHFHGHMRRNVRTELSGNEIWLADRAEVNGRQGGELHSTLEEAGISPLEISLQ